MQLSTLLIVFFSSAIRASSELGYTHIDSLLNRFAPRQGPANLQSFAGQLGGLAPAIVQSQDPKRPFQVANSTFPDFPTAGQKTCDTQYNSCGNAANGAQKDQITHNMCDSQHDACMAAQSSAPLKTFQQLQQAPQQTSIPDPNDPDFDLICDLN
ncbi:hypothetical protein NA57DRAFT_54446 [Rhizodiscina lignyota]|uniref:Uncharacterized protein n=1 Tax=Rhizodiscina lignyota TaxID=1504668 RepID=A0A9P4II05_9PEZI|nr:hypothetical protein NA57DRAFT_54446 [Rhizodiscina lignyota]